MDDSETPGSTVYMHSTRRSCIEIYTQMPTARIRLRPPGGTEARNVVFVISPADRDKKIGSESLAEADVVLRFVTSPGDVESQTNIVFRRNDPPETDADGP